MSFEDFKTRHFCSFYLKRSKQMWFLMWLWPFSTFFLISSYCSDSGIIGPLFNSIFKSIFSRTLEGWTQLDQQPDTQTVAVLDHVSVVFCLPGLSNTHSQHLISSKLLYSLELKPECLSCLCVEWTNSATSLLFIIVYTHVRSPKNSMQIEFTLTTTKNYNMLIGNAWLGLHFWKNTLLQIHFAALFW